MNPRYLLSELAWVGRAGIGLRSRARLAVDCISARNPGVWSHDRQLMHEVRLRIHEKSFTVALRNNGSDVRILTTLLKDGEYDVPGLVWEEIGSIIDAGANIGITSLYFHARAPRARILAVEPEPGNLQVLERNLEINALGAELVPAALWGAVGTMPLEVSDSAMSHKLAAAPVAAPGVRSAASSAGWPIEVPTVDMPSLLGRLPAGTVDLVKLDIEGAERDVFEHSEGWIDSVNRFVIECHPGHGLGSAQLRALLQPLGFEVTVYRPEYDLIYARR